ncbi:hypothetical protein ABZ942_29850 [Nocardia sp. NPDC046473]|uniref:terpene synthase family protein n=1 Tax=Nocardia sp. NPDC046473 TaxID=3155733 RepID=UPI0033DBAEE8
MIVPDTASIIPTLPFKARSNPQWELAEEHARAWLGHVYRHRTEEDKKRSEEAQVARLVGYLFPDAGLEDLVTLTAVGEVVLMYDDRAADGDSSLADVHAAAYRVQHVLETGHTTSTDDPDLIALAEVLQRIYPRQSESWRARFRRNVWNLVFASAAEQQNREEGRIPGIRECIAIRRETIGALTVLDLAEFAGHYELSDALYNDPHIHQLRQCCCDIIGWTNDLGSYHREDAAGEVNLLHALQAENGTSLTAAFDAAKEMIETRISDFIETERTLRDGEMYRTIRELDRAAVDAAVETMRHAIAGNRRWQAEVSRYTTAQ